MKLCCVLKHESRSVQYRTDAAMTMMSETTGRIRRARCGLRGSTNVQQLRDASWNKVRRYKLSEVTHASRAIRGDGNNPRQNLRRRLGAQSGHNHARCGE